MIGCGGEKERVASAREDMGISARVKDRAARQQAWQGWSPSLAPGGCKFVLWSPAVEQMQPPVLLMLPSQGERRPSAVAGTKPEKGLDGPGD